MSNAVIPGRPHYPVPAGPPTEVQDDGHREIMAGWIIAAAFFVAFLGWPRSHASTRRPTPKAR